MDVLKTNIKKQSRSNFLNTTDNLSSPGLHSFARINLKIFYDKINEKIENKQPKELLIINKIIFADPTTYIDESFQDDMYKKILNIIEIKLNKLGYTNAALSKTSILSLYE